MWKRGSVFGIEEESFYDVFILILFFHEEPKNQYF